MKNQVVDLGEYTLLTSGVMICYDYDWGSIWAAKFDEEDLIAMKEKCRPLCSSTCFHTMSYYRSTAVPDWVRKHVRVG